jgi:threonylcarbamoyladenosine tRNA methylthiotransferase MtaB
MCLDHKRPAEREKQIGNVSDKTTLVSAAERRQAGNPLQSRLMRVCFTNLGCKLNQAEIERLARDFTAAGHSLAGSAEEADLHVVNSCTVTATAARASRKAARRGCRGRSGPLRTVLTGCWATDRPDEAARLAGVDLVVLNADKERLLEKVTAAFPELAEPAPLPPSFPEIPVPYVPLPLGHTRALVKVEDGCNMRCSFCIIPSTRGRQRSRPLAEVVAEVRGLVDAGVREVVLTGVQISAWRDAGRRLPELVEAVLAHTGAPRLRLTSIAPWDLDGPLERLLALWEDRRLCRHLHLSLQSGSTAVLRRMRRPYTAASYLGLLDRVRAAIPGVAVTTDVITGFPGETAAEHEESLATVAAAGFARVHVFPFSPRPGTAAAELPDPVAPDVAKARAAEMLDLAERADLGFRRSCLGRRETVLWERPRGGVEPMGQGLTDNYVRVLCPEGASLWNRFSEVELAALAQDGVMGVSVSGPSQGGQSVLEKRACSSPPSSSSTVPPTSAPTGRAPGA